MRWKNVLMVVSVAVNVGVVAWLVFGPTQPAIFISEGYAQARAVTGGGYAATTGHVSSSREALWVIDNTEKRMLVYVFPSAKGRPLDLLGGRDLRKDFGENLAGELLIIGGEVSGGIDGMYVIDPVGKRLIAYGSRGGREIEVLGAANLAQDFNK